MSITLTEYELDPRPDLFADHPEWVAILDLAYAEGDMPDANGVIGNIHGILHALRCGGARLSAHATYGLVIDHGDWDEEAYKGFKVKHLAPRGKQVLRLLFAAANRVKAQVAAGWKRPATLKEYAAERVQAVEARLAAAGWTKDEIWREGSFRAPDGHQTQSVYQTLLNDQGVAIGQITANHVEFRWGLRGREVAQRLHREDPALGKQGTLMGGAGNVADMGGKAGNGEGIDHASE